MRMLGFILAAIPEECFGEHPKKPIWGGISPKAIGEEYVLPEYIIGYVPQHKDKKSEEYYSSRHIEYNQERDRVKYKYFFEEGSQGKLMNTDDLDI